MADHRIRSRCQPSFSGHSQQWSSTRSNNCSLHDEKTKW